ncbi:hypothetical protein CR103_18660 [Massilia psychrophila]|uniref:Uncharacterized protein n=1 Tax=Massilia psychrophila TaxID=1603353 RepID=A0A2G8SX09_9BURK|nr:hypothetical protein CR103_18660 [Massilia psychrophila]
MEVATCKRGFATNLFVDQDLLSELTLSGAAEENFGKLSERASAGLTISLLWSQEWTISIKMRYG